ncbi:hypothetical protein Taro_000205 [Colocasia esculenta]|uniref:Uncharacterized protein n=1 Tax=Colocasia esculenta TaxID=4460 RepID=A0A843TGW5_COLES|nr:hypothetical protein [Colocasia esculenta]
MEKYLEEKKASQKRPTAPFQQQDRKMAAYQSPQHPVAASSRQSVGRWRESASSVGAASIRSETSLDFSRESSDQHQLQQRQRHQRQLHGDQEGLEPKLECVYRFFHGNVGTPTTGVDTGFQTLRQNDEEKVKCVDTASSGVDTRPSSQRTHVDTSDPSQRTNSASFGQCVDTLPGGVDTLRLKPKIVNSSGHMAAWVFHARRSQEYSGRREEERERGICNQRSRAAPPREEEGEEEEELEIAAVLIQKKIQPSLYLRFEYFVLYFGAVVLWCLSYGAQVLVNLLNSQVVFGVGRCAYLLGFFELLNSKRIESSCSSLYCTCASGSSVVRRWTCNKSRHMKVDCSEGKKEKHKTHKKEFHKKKNKAMVATWSDDESSDCNEESSSSEGNEISFMAGSSEEQYSMQEESKSILEEGSKSGKEASASRGAEQHRQGKKKEKKEK